MMNGHEKSDPVIVAVKLANKAERSVAEPVEPRVGAEGNADQAARSGLRAGKARQTSWIACGERPDCRSPPSTRGGSRMRESRTYGSVRGAPGSFGRSWPGDVVERHSERGVS